MQVKKNLSALSKKRFDTQQAAQQATEQLFPSDSYYQLSNIVIKQHEHYKSGRQAKDAKPQRLYLSNRKSRFGSQPNKHRCRSCSLWQIFWKDIYPLVYHLFI